MDRAIFNLTKYSIFLYLHCTDTQRNIHYSSALLPLSVVANIRITWPTSMTTDVTILTDRKTHTRAHTHTHSHTRFCSDQCDRGAEEGQAELL